ncbi:MAG TPA: porin family protein [Prolixibacteraceae bacterium]|nr:porin family protein [Prolixibacteraceae bacterium]
MKKLTIIIAFTVFAFTSNAKGLFDIGPKVGINTTKISANMADYNQETITKFQFGAFARINAGPIYVQPEAYFNSKEYIYMDQLSASTKDKFDLKTVDVPVLVGLKIINMEALNVRIMAGPVFSFLTDKNAKDQFNEDNIKNSRFGWQYGAGVDFMFLTLDARMESYSKNFAPSYDKNGVFILSLGVKLF